MQKVDTHWMYDSIKVTPLLAKRIRSEKEIQKEQSLQLRRSKINLRVNHHSSFIIRRV